VGRFLLPRDRKLASNCFIVWLTTVFLWWTGGKGCLSGLVPESNGLVSFDSRSRVSSLVQVWFWALLVFFQSEVNMWWKLTDL